MNNKPTMSPGWYIVEDGFTKSGDQVLMPSTFGKGKRWHRVDCYGLSIENKGGLIYRRRYSRLNLWASFCSFLRRVCG